LDSWLAIDGFMDRCMDISHVSMGEWMVWWMDGYRRNG